MSSSNPRKRRNGSGIKSNSTEPDKMAGTSSGSLLETILQYDERFTKSLSLCASSSSPLGSFRPLMKVLEISCHGVTWLLGTIIVFICVHRPEDVELLVNLFLALIFDLIVVGTFKVAFRRQRPSHNQMDMFATVAADHYSFPSGHATRAAMLAIFLSERLPFSTLPMLGIFSWSFFITISRVLLGRHHIIDVVFGFLIGILEYVVYCQFWVPKDQCLLWLETYFGHVHL